MIKPVAIAADIECTSFDREGGDMLTCALVEIMSNHTIGRSKEFYFRPEGTNYFTEKAQEIHGISHWRAMQFPERKKSCNEMLHWLTPIHDLLPLPMVYHANGNFDYRWIESTFRKENMHYHLYKCFRGDQTISTLKMAKQKLKHIPNYKLNTIAKHYGLELDHHKAISDAVVCAEAYIKMINDIDTWTGELDFK